MDSLQKNYLAEMARWQKFLGVVMMVFTVLMILIGLFFIVAGSVLGDSMGDIFGEDVPNGFAGILAGVIYFLGGILYFFFARYLLRSAKALKAYSITDDEADLTEGLKNNKSYFKLSGVLLIISLCLLALLIVAVIVAAIAAAI
ncbi:MAG: hypothetical protein II841_00875 [Bacteroidales bacterium]|nr:hypothetical protein [Bacteroidales bacterium]